MKLLVQKKPRDSKKHISGACNPIAVGERPGRSIRITMQCALSKDENIVSMDIWIFEFYIYIYIF